MHTAGGRVSITINGVPYSARGEIKINPSNVSTEFASNQDGTVYRTVKPQPVKSEVTFDRFVDVEGRTLKWDTSLMLANFNATFVEDDVGAMHLLSKAGFQGDPSINLADGSVDGIQICAERYETVRT